MPPSLPETVEEEAAPPTCGDEFSMAAAADSISFERIFIDYSFFCIHYARARRCAFRRGWPGHSYTYHTPSGNAKVRANFYGFFTGLCQSFSAKPARVCSWAM